jgi:hypothetical protein
METNGYIVIIEDFPGFPPEKVSGIFETREEAEGEAYEYGRNYPYLVDFLEVVKESYYKSACLSLVGIGL